MLTHDKGHTRPQSLPLTATVDDTLESMLVFSCQFSFWYESDPSTNYRLS